MGNATAQLQTERPGTTGNLRQHDWSVRRHLLNEELFRGVLLRERNRADRSNQPFALLLVKLDAQTATGPLRTRAAVIATLSAAKRETDVLGWFEQQTTVGLIVPEIPAADPSFAPELEARVRRELGRRLDARTIDRFSIQLCVHRALNRGVSEEFRPVDPILEEMRPRRERATMYEIVKRALDLAASLTLLIVLAPLFLLIAALVKLGSPGPVFFRQVRVGQLMKPFTMLKFRTMHVNVKHDIHHAFVTSFIKSGAQAQQAGQNGLFKITNDPRVTAIGRILRKTSLDELPQLWNVLRGEMSLVGPRPPLHYEVEQYQPWHRRRVLEAKPGITGLWQVSGRSRTTFDEMVRLDLRYARTRSLWTDMRILLATPTAVITGKGAC